MFDTHSGELCFHQKSEYGDSICNVFEDDAGNRRIIDTANVAKETQLNLDIKNATYRTKQNRFFSDKHHDGWRVIGRVPMWFFAQHPELKEEGEIEKLLDKYPMWKAIDVNWTRTKDSNKLFTGVELGK